MRSFQVVIGQNASPQQFTMLRADARSAGNLLVHQKLGAIALSTNPTNGQTLTLDINGTNVVITFVSSIGAAAGNVLIGASAAATCVNLVALLNQPQTTTASGVALSAANQALISYLSWPLSGTTITPCSNNTALYAPLTSFSASTTVTSGSYTAQTMQLYAEPGVVYVNGTRVKFAGGSTPTVTAPASNPRIDLLTIDNSGTLAFVTGTENASPAVPTYPADKVVLCEVYNVVGETGLFDFDNQQTGQGYIQSDVRPMLGLQFNPGAIPDTMLPATDATYNLGSGSFQWNNIYAKSNIYVNGLPAAISKSGGSGADGALSVTSGTTTLSAGSAAYLEKNYTSISITGGTLAFSNPHATLGTTIVLRSQGGVTITSGATRAIDVRSMGGGPSTGVLTQVSVPGNHTGGGGTGGSGPAGFGSIGGAGSSQNASSPSAFQPLYPTCRQLWPGGSGSAGGAAYGGFSGAAGAAGGLGGGALYIECAGAYNCTGVIDASGANGATSSASDGGYGSGGGGGGAGGPILVLYGSLTADSGTYTVSGGIGGSGDAGGTATGGTGGNGAAGASYRGLNTYFS